MRYARRCGVRAATQGLARNAGLIKHLLGAAAPDGIIRALIEANKDGALGDIAPHLFSFGGIGATARWPRRRRGAHQDRSGWVYGRGGVTRVLGAAHYAVVRCRPGIAGSSRVWNDPGSASHHSQALMLRRARDTRHLIPAISFASPVTSRICSPVLARSTT